jgi:4-amino-4-deoxy-L-arabinose transferase-like glycosyltransferase
VAGSLASGRRPLVAICAFVVLLGAWNTARYETNAGYDADAHMQYADGLIPGWHLPHHEGEYYTPPGYYLIAGTVDWIVKQTGYGNPDRGGQVINVLFMLGTVLLVAAIARELWPGRRRIELGAAAFVAFLPVAVEAEAMFHPEPLSMFLCTLALWLCVRTFADRRYAWGLGIALGLTQLVRAFGLYVVGAALLALFAGRRWRELAIALVLAVAIPAPWYIHQRQTYGGQPAFPQPAQGTALPAAFYYGLGLPTVISAPYRTNHYTRWLPVTYDGLWGDYFGVWDWHAGRHSSNAQNATVTFHPSRSAKRSLVIQSVVGLVPTLLAVIGWLLLARSSLRRPKALAVAALPILGFIGYLYFAVNYWTHDGDLLKATYMLSTVGAWGLGFGYALDRIRGRWWPVTLALLGVAGLVELPFLVL